MNTNVMSDIKPFKMYRNIYYVGSLKYSVHLIDTECGLVLVNFPQYGDKPDIATISVHESDMVKIAALNVQINEQIRKQFETKS